MCFRKQLFGFYSVNFYNTNSHCLFLLCDLQSPNLGLSQQTQEGPRGLWEHEDRPVAVVLEHPPCHTLQLNSDYMSITSFKVSPNVSFFLFIGEGRE